MFSVHLAQKCSPEHSKDAIEVLLIELEFLRYFHVVVGMATKRWSSRSSSEAKIRSCCQDNMFCSPRMSLWLNRWCGHKNALLRQSLNAVQPIIVRHFLEVMMHSPVKLHPQWPLHQEVHASNLIPSSFFQPLSSNAGPLATSVRMNSMVADSGQSLDPSGGRMPAAAWCRVIIFCSWRAKKLVSSRSGSFSNCSYDFVSLCLRKSLKMLDVMKETACVHWKPLDIDCTTIIFPFFIPKGGFPTEWLPQKAYD